MLRDVFYYGKKPNVHPREKFARDLVDARNQATTEHFWIINEFCDYRNFDWDFDFEFLPDEDVWAEDHNNVWPSKHQKDSGTWLCPKEFSEIIIYRNDVDPLHRKNELNEHWNVLERIDFSKFDLSWHPDPTDPPYIYAWGCKFFPVELKICLEYEVPGATEYKYMDQIVELLPNHDHLKIIQEIDESIFDLSWRPSPIDPPYIYVWGNKYIPAELKSTLEYHVLGATEKKYMPELLDVVPEINKWKIHQKNEFDLSWRPDPREPAYIYTWGNKFVPAEIEPTMEYVCEGATERKYMGNVDVLPQTERWVEHQQIDKSKFDLTWRPDPREPAYIYVWGNKYVSAELKPTIEYHTPGATERKYMEELVDVLPEWDRWYEIQTIDKTKFDLSWRPDPREPAYIYVWGNKHISGELKPTLEYHTPGATEKKYMGELVSVVPELDKWNEIQIIDKTKFDLSWRPDPREPAYIYVWGNKWIPGELKSTLEYHCAGATEKKYMGELDVLPEMDRYNVVQNVINFDYTWRPDPREPAYIYVWGNKWIPGELKPTLEYVCPGASERKYMGNVEVGIEINRWNIVQQIDKTKFDLTWRPDPREPAYIYVWGNKHIPAQLKPTIEYHVEGASERKYMDEIVDVVPDNNWIEHQQIDKTRFDLTWRPDPREPAYIYTWGNKYVPAEIQPTLEYITPGATERKYMGNVEVLPELDRYKIVQEVVNFDYTWRPDPREPAYVYVWGNKWIPGELKSTLEYHVPGATECKYMDELLDVVPEKSRWITHQDPVDFDYTWRPDPREPAYVYVWGNKWIPGELQPTIEYFMPNATDRKYMGDIDVKPQCERWVEHISVDKTKFDLSWRPDPREPAYIYTWGNKYVPAEIKPTLEYVTPCATERKYMGDIDVVPQYECWKEYIPVDKTKFDLSWRPDPREPAYIYTWGNKFVSGEMRPTLEYYAPGATEKKYMGNVEILPMWNNWKYVEKVDSTKFDFTWLPDPREPAYIYTWGNKYVPAEIEPTLEYYVEDATERKYMGNVEVAPQLDRYVIHTPVTNFDLSWRPDPREPAYIYTWGNKYVPAEIEPTIEYITPGATERKYMGNVEVLQERDRWVEHQQIDKTKFDLSWRPDPREPAYIYTWGNKYVPAEIEPTIEYITPGATERKYMGNVDVLPQLDRWKEYQQIDKTKFDLSWRPDPREPAYIYVWGNKHIRPELKPTLEYHVPGATEYKYIQEPVEVLPEYDRWNIVQDVVDFDFTWRPDPREPAYIYTWGNKWIPGELKPTLEYHCTGAVECKYMGDVNVKPEYEKYQILLPIDKTSFDFTWRPDPREPAYIYVWGNQSNNAQIEPTVEYHVPGATDRKYMTDVLVKTLPDVQNYKVLIPVDEFDFTWRPDPNSPPYIYVFGNQWHDAMTEPTIEYYVPGGTDKKYITDVVAKVSRTQEHWKTLLPVESFDYSWRPNPHSQPYIYVFGNQWHQSTIEPTVEYHQPGATDKKYITDVKAIVKSTSTEKHWKRLIEVESFDYSWRPDPGSPPYIYVFGNKWNDAATEPTIEYHMEGATDRKYMDAPLAVPKVELQHWSINNSDDLETFDFTWRPNPHSPPQIYQWPENGPRYTVLGATEVVLMNTVNKTTKKVINRYKIKTTLEDLINEHPEEVFWALNPDINYDKFDFNWKPDETNFRHINVFGNEYSKDTQTYYINAPLYLLGYKNYNYVEDQTVEIIVSNLSMFYIDKNNVESISRYNKLKEKYPNLQKTRYLNSWVETITRCIKKSETKLFWVLSSEIDYTDFTFDFYPSPWQMKMIHVFGTQWNHWGNTYLINSETFADDTKYVKIIEHLNNLNFVKTKRAKAVDCLYDVYLIDHGNFETMNVVIDIERKFNVSNIEVIKYRENYLNTFKDILNHISDKNVDFIWVCSSLCKYDNFDFAYVCDPFAREHLHVFPSNKQKFGDTFLVNVKELKRLVSSIDCLENYGKINFNNHQRVTRFNAPEIIVKEDTHAQIIKYPYKFPYAILKTFDHKDVDFINNEPISLWSNESKTIVKHSTGGTILTVPREAKQYVRKELYDYPYVKDNEVIKSNPLDIVFLSNGEVNAEENYKHLLEVTKNLPNRVVRVDGVNGRVNAYHAAANTSNTPWMFTVFAKLRVNEYFDFNWQPDRLQMPKHYIFTATNPVNELEYGHQAMIAYNKNLVLNNNGIGLDFTLDSPTQVVEINSGVAMFDTDEYSAWRTAFRESIKLKYDDTAESRERLKKWLTVGIGPYGEHSIRGAKDGVKYFEEVNSDIDKLKLSYEWKWLKDRYDNTKRRNKRKTS